MTTIAQLPPASSVGASDLLPLSQVGLLYSVTVSQLTSSLQPLINVPTGELLGRISMGAGAPESLGVGAGLGIYAGSLGANGEDHASFPVQSIMSLSDDVVISAGGSPGLLPVTALRGLFEAGSGVSIDPNGVIAVTVSAIAGPAGPQGAPGPAGPAGPAGVTGPSGSGLAGPAAANSASSVGASDYVALWQNGSVAWMPYGQFLGGQTIDELPSAAPAADSDEILVAQGSNTLAAQNFGAIWTYVQNKLPTAQAGVVELTSNTVLDSTEHNNKILVASAAITLTANFNNMGPGFTCTLINLAPGSIIMGTGISSGSGSGTLPPGAATTLLGLSYSGGSLVWWSGVVPNAPTITIGSIAAPGLDTSFQISGGIFNDAPTALDYSSDGGLTWSAAQNLVITANAYSFTAAGLAAGTYSLHVRDHVNIAVIGVSNSFTIAAPTIVLNKVSSTLPLNNNVALSGTVSPGDSPVQVGLSASANTAPASWVNAMVSGGSWSASLTPAVAGVFYIWAEQQGAPTVTAVSGPVMVVAASVTVSAPSTGSAGNALSVTGTVTPAADAVNVQLSAQNAVAPSSGWTAASNNSGSFSAVLTPAAAGTYYVWAQDASTGLSAVSPAVTVSAGGALTFGINNPGGSYVHGVSTVPLNGPVTPPQNVATQVALSTSNTVVPTSGWQSAVLLQSNSLWAVYYTTPATAGTYYVWAETAAGGSATVSTFTIPVT
jgi:hypothetical protein